MTEEIWLEIPIALSSRLRLKEGKNGYFSEDSLRQKIFVTRLFGRDKLSEFIATHSSDACKVRARHFKFTKADIGKATILELVPDDSAQESDSQFEQLHCPELGQYLPLRPIRTLVHRANLTKDVQTTYMGNIEFIVHDKVLRVIDENACAGIAKVSAVYDKISQELIPDYWLLEPRQTAARVTSDTDIEKGNYCSSHDLYEKFLTKGDLLNISKGSWEGYDICFTREFFGEPISSQGKGILVSKRLHDLFVMYRISGVSFAPAFLK
jgi:hypothetical protein